MVIDRACFNKVVEFGLFAILEIFSERSIKTYSKSRPKSITLSKYPSSKMLFSTPFTWISIGRIEQNFGIFKRFLFSSNNAHVARYRFDQTNDDLKEVTLIAIESEDLITYPPSFLKTTSKSILSDVFLS
ncbi:MAG: hypothetical protein ACHQUC_00265 [Chlamydiales bacterium]